MRGRKGGGGIYGRNHRLSKTAIYEGIYRICLEDEFCKIGKILTRKGDTLDAATIIERHCRTADKCSLNDLFNLEKELTGSVGRVIPMKAANTAMVRTDRETYVSDRHVRFDIDATDEAISYFVREDYLPLKAFTTFVNFPDCGQVWNPFLLESYCRRFSRRFRFDSASVNLGNIGAVIRKNCLMNYVDIVVDAIVKSGVSLRDDDVGRFLIDSGYAGKITAAKLGEVMGKAKAVRKRRG